MVGDRNSLPDCLEITAYSNDGEIMGVRHKEYEIEGVQFHPESIASENGLRITSYNVCYTKLLRFGSCLNFS